LLQYLCLVNHVAMNTLCFLSGSAPPRILHARHVVCDCVWMWVCACACVRACVRMRARVCGCVRGWVSSCACVHARLAAPSCGASIVPEEDESVSSRERSRGRASRRRGAAAAAACGFCLCVPGVVMQRPGTSARFQNLVFHLLLPCAIVRPSQPSVPAECPALGATALQATWRTLRCGGCMHCRNALCGAATGCAALQRVVRRCNALCGAATGCAAVDARRQAVLCGEPARRQLEHRHAHPLCCNVLRCAASNYVAPPCNALRRLATCCGAGTLGRSLLNAVSLGSFSAEWYPARY
jgi:hypothetical protein